MSYKNPIEHTIASPTLLDKEIANIQSKLSTLPWLEKSFGRAFKRTRLSNGRKVNYPAIFQAWKKDYYDAFPNDNIKSYSFIHPDPSEITEYNTKGRHIIERNISVILFFNLEEIDNTFQYRFTEKLKEDVILVLGKLSPNKLQINNITDEIEEVFNDFTADEINPVFLKDKYGALKFECTIFYQNENCDLNSYTP